MPRRWLVLLTSACVICLMSGVLVFWWLLPREPVSRATCQRIEPGMSIAQVESLLGRRSDSVLNVGGVELGHVWVGKDGSSIMVAFDNQGSVVSRMFTPGGQSPSFSVPPG